MNSHNIEVFCRASNSEGEAVSTLRLRHVWPSDEASFRAWLGLDAACAQATGAFVEFTGGLTQLRWRLPGRRWCGPSMRARRRATSKARPFGRRIA